MAAYVVCLRILYAAKGGYSPDSLRVRILSRKMHCQKPLCSALNSKKKQNKNLLKIAKFAKISCMWKFAVLQYPAGVLFH